VFPGIVFDLDDTLYPERAFVLSGFHAVSVWAQDALGIPAAICFKELQGLFDVGYKTTTFDHWLRLHHFEMTLLDHMITLYREHDPKIDPFLCVPGLLLRLRRCSRIGLVSDGRPDLQRRKLAALRLNAAFDAVVLTADLGPGHSKPSAHPFEVVLDRLEVTPSEAVYVADNAMKDFLGARRVGMYTVQITVPDAIYGGLTAPTSAHAAHVQIEDLGDLEVALSRAPQSSWPAAQPKLA
jgi:putative hydrolase of the HAD superfamily